MRQARASRKAATVNERRNTRYDEQWGAHVDTRGSAFRDFLNAPSAQKEIGATITRDEGIEAQKFLDENPSYLPSSTNWFAMQRYLEFNNLQMTAENLAIAWRSVRANGGTTREQAAEKERQQAGKVDVERMSDREVLETMKAITDARMKRRKKLAQLERVKFDE